MYHIVRYSGLFGFIKPWTAVRDGGSKDGKTFSQQFLTPSIIAGIERKLFPEILTIAPFKIHKILRHRLSYSGISVQQEQTYSFGWQEKKDTIFRVPSILNRGVMLNPVLHLAFGNREDACVALGQHICLCRNEDLLYSDSDIIDVDEDSFDHNEELFNGFELVFEKTDDAFLVGFNRLNNNEPMYGYLKIVGTPVRS
jgi:hypothetical protein